MIRKILLTATAFAALSSVALAADLPARVAAPVPVMPTLNWTGFYVGVNAGGAFSQNNLFDGYDEIFAYYSSATTHGTHGLVGGQAGYNWQIRSAVLGVEVDGAGVFGKAHLQGYGDGYGVTTSFGGLVTARARAGLAIDNVLVYATGGAAFAKLKNDFIYDGYACGSDESSGCSNKWQTGWTVGGGVEVMIAPNWSLKGEYLYVGLPSQSIAVEDEPGYAYHSATSLSIARAGVNYHF